MRWVPGRSMLVVGLLCLGMTGVKPASGAPSGRIWDPERSLGSEAGQVQTPEPKTPQAREPGAERSVIQSILEQGTPDLPEGPEDLFERGNRLYQENEFRSALAHYAGLLEAGYESSDLYYNLGNAYFKTGNLGRAILNWERALRLDPGDSDTQANLELARSLTADEIEPLPRFWLLSALSWWVNLLPRQALALLLALGYLLCAGGLCLFVLFRGQKRGRVGIWVSLGGVSGVVLLGLTYLGRVGTLGGKEWGIILEEAVPVQSAPSSEDDLTLFLVHEGTKVRIDQTSETWLEVVLEDGKVGWVPTDVLEII